MALRLVEPRGLSGADQINLAFKKAGLDHVLQQDGRIADVLQTGIVLQLCVDREVPALLQTGCVTISEYVAK